eukprot:3096993-Prymnesium_polylepis.1
MGRSDGRARWLGGRLMGRSDDGRARARHACPRAAVARSNVKSSSDLPLICSPAKPSSRRAMSSGRRETPTALRAGPATASTTPQRASRVPSCPPRDGSTAPRVNGL